MEEDRSEQMRPLLTTVTHPSCRELCYGEALGRTCHRAVYIGVHVPLGRQSRRRHRHRGHRHHRRRKDRGSDREDGRESPTYDTPSQRVQFILGTEDDDEEHIPHDLFTEMDELSFRDGHAYEWKETARWLKFEEDVEDGGERWSKPYVATLSLHSLFELRSCILNGTVMLDMRANTIEEIADMIIDNMIASGQLDESLREKVREAVLKRHHHQNEKKLSNRIPLVRSFADIGKKHSDPHLLEKNGEGLSASHLSLLRLGISASSQSLRRDSRVSILLNYLLPGASPFASRPERSPPLTLRSTSCPPQLQVPELLVTGPAGEDIPEVVVHPPDDDEPLRPEHLEEEADRPAPPHEGKYLGPRALLCSLPVLHHTRAGALSCMLNQSQFALIFLFLIFSLCILEILTLFLFPGMLASPQSAPGNLEHTKGPEHKANGGGGSSRENSTVDFSKVDMNFMKKIPPGAEASNVLIGEVDFLERPIIAFIRLAPAVLLTGLTEVPVPTRFLFLLLGPFGKGPQYHEIGRSIATLMTDEIFHDVAYKAKDRIDILSGIDEFLDQVTVLPPGEWDPTIRIEPPKSVPSQVRIHKSQEYSRAVTSCYMIKYWFCGGLILDIKRKAPFYWSDIRDAISLQCLASVLFLYCACMSPVITFGGLLGEATEGSISAIESLFGASLTGIAFSVFAGQPLTILGSTGPVLVFEKILYKFCKDYGLSYLSLRTSIGLWTAFLCLLLVATDASSLVCYITRFTEEAFAALICIIFIYEALEKLVDLGEMYPINMNNDLDNLTFYTCLCKFVQACLFQLWQNTWFTRPGLIRSNGVLVRSTISDFAVFLTILIMVVVDYLVGIPSPKLQVPDRFEPTSKHRGWLIDPLGDNPWWTLLAAAIPALLCTILIFMDQQITAVIINRKEHKLKKGCGYHLDLLVVSVMLGICSIMGLPWFVAATVLSISHVNSLKVESECSAPGEQPKFLGIREQRVTGLMIFLLMGMSVFMTSFIPMPVLYGVFLYMGVSSLKGIQFFDRIKLFGMPAKHQPDLIYLRYVPLWKVHVFTIVQLTCLVLLWVIKASSAAVVFPMMVLALVFIRKLLDFGFTKRELSYLDDLMPESKKKNEDDKKKKEKEVE
ncbi:S4A8 protein, partial [Amia calva]|nr:S4A8 protein [Amia calva]